MEDRTLLAGGPVILGGDDLTQHGSRSGTTLLNGWLYIQKALENLAPGVTVVNGGSVAVLGSADSTATSGDAGAAYHFAVPNAAATTALSGVVDVRNGATAINQFFTDLANGTVAPAIIVIAGTGATNDLDAAEGAALTNNATAIADFVNAGGGLLSHGFDATTDAQVAYGWLSVLIPGIAFPIGCDTATLALTPLAQTLFPGLTNAHITSGPCHNHFLNHGLPVLAEDGMGRAIIIGGNVTIPSEFVLTQDSDTNIVGTSHTVTATIKEGSPLVPVVGKLVTFQVTAGPNMGTSGMLSVNADGTTDANGQVSFTYLGDGGVGVDTITASYVDSNGDTQTKSLNKTWTAANVLPAVMLDPPGVIKEDDEVVLTGVFVDPDLSDAHDLVVDWDDPNSPTVAMFAPGATAGLSVGDLFPSSTTADVLEITSLDLASGAVGFEIRGHRYLDDGAAPGNGTTQDTSMIVVTVSDAGGMGQDSEDVLVQNEAPELGPGSVVISATMNNKAEIGDAVTLSADFTDVGTLDAHTVVIDWGDGNSSHSTLTPADFSSFLDSTGGVTGSFTAQHTYSAGGGFTVMITVFDDDAGSVATTTEAWINILPLVRLDPPDVIKEGDEMVLSGLFVDPDPFDAHDLVVNWDDPNYTTDSMFTLGSTDGLSVGDLFPSTTTTAVLEIASLDLASGTVGFEIRGHWYLDDGAAPGNGTAEDTSTILVTASDAGGMDQDSVVVLVQNEAPELILGSDFNCACHNMSQAGDAITLSADFTDVGTLDAHTVAIDWGDGTTSHSVLTPADFTNFQDSTGGAIGSFTAHHAYTMPGVFTVTITVFDDDGGTDTRSTSALVRGVSWNGGELMIVGTERRDWVTIAKLGSSTRVYTNILPTFATYKTADVSRIVAYLCGGDDRLIINSDVKLPAIVHGGTGDDLLKAGGGPAVLLGDEGDDTLVGGDDRDILIGGLGADLVMGGRGQDMLIGGTTMYDCNDRALVDLMTEWNKNDSYSVRVSRLRDGTGATGLRLARGLTLFDDLASDRLVGSFDADWFLFDLQDTLPERDSDEAVN